MQFNFKFTKINATKIPQYTIFVLYNDIKGVDLVYEVFVQKNQLNYTNHTGGYGPRP